MTSSAVLMFMTPPYVPLVLSRYNGLVGALLPTSIALSVRSTECTPMVSRSSSSLVVGWR